MPAGLSITIRCASSWTTSSAISSGPIWLSFGAGMSISTASPATTRAFASQITDPFTRTAPAVSRRASRVRDSAAPSGASRTSALSSRTGGSSPIRNESGSCPMDDSPPPVSPATLKFLARLVTVLTATMIVGVLVIIGLLVTRLQQSDSPALALPPQITLPAGATARAITLGGDWYAVVTTDDRILVYGRDSGDLRQTIILRPAD